MIPVLALVILFIIATFVSIAKFNVANPFAVFNGLCQITFADKQYAEIQTYPKVIVAKPQTSLESYMVAKGFTENKEEQLGALRMFENDVAHQYIFHSVNGYFEKWQWRE